MSAENYSSSEKVTAYISSIFDKDPEFFTIPSNRPKAIKEFLENNPDEKKNTVNSLFSRLVPKIAKTYNVEPEEVKRETPDKFSKKLKPNITKKPIAPPGIKNPVIDSAQKQSIADGMPKKIHQYEIKQSQVKATCDAIYGIFEMISQDIPTLTDEESNDLGDLWQPVAQDKLGNSSRGQAALAVGGTAGIITKKVRQARANRKTRLEKESKESKSTEPSEPAPTGEKQ